ncbi:MAG: hypothetical protein DDG58_05795 [Ardenticatenia bacterium]|nr:MAG: hypothetical protein DDG58_05795 [Ardenticatenia bacterium]
MSQSLQIDYTLVTYIVIGIFALVGFMRGWWKEAVTTGLLTMLILVVKRPEAAAGVFDFIDKLVMTIWQALQRVRETSDLVASALPAEEPPVIDAKRQSIYIIILVAAVVASYFFSKIGLTQTMSAGARLIGALLGAYNGYIVLNLLDWLMRGRLPGAEEVTAAGVPPSEVTLTVTNLPTTRTLEQDGVVLLLLAGGFLVFLLAVVTSIRFGRREPPLYHKARTGKQGKKEKI